MFGSRSRHFHFFFSALPIQFNIRTARKESIARAESGLQRALFLAIFTGQMVSTGRFHHGNVILLRALVEAPALAANNLRAPDIPSNATGATLFTTIANRVCHDRATGYQKRHCAAGTPARASSLRPGTPGQGTAYRRTASRLSWPTRFPAARNRRAGLTRSAFSIYPFAR